MASAASGRDEDFRADLYAEYVTTHFAELGANAATTLEAQILPLLPADRAAAILDIGCGSGELVELMSQAGYRRVSGVDLSEEQVAIARGRGISGVAQADLFNHLDSLDEPLDAIVAVDVLEHLEKAEIVRALRLICATLRPGGRVIVRVPNAQSPFGGRFRYGDFTHATSFTQHSISQVLLATGFSDIEIRPADPVVHGVLSAIRLGLWKLVATGYKFALAVETGLLRGQLVTQNILVLARRRESGPPRTG